MCGATARRSSTRSSRTRQPESWLGCWPKRTCRSRWMSDDQVLSSARAEQRAVLTLNRKDCFRLHREQPDHEGIIACTFDPDFVGQARRIHEVLPAEGSLRGAVLRVNRPQR